jgi:hypothetical protein
MQMFGSFPDELLSEFYAAYAEAAKTQKEKPAQPPTLPSPKRQAARTLSNANATGAERQNAINEIGRRAFEH